MIFVSLVEQPISLGSLFLNLHFSVYLQAFLKSCTTKREKKNV